MDRTTALDIMRNIAGTVTSQSFEARPISMLLKNPRAFSFKTTQTLRSSESFPTESTI
jgi:hypothetical protein